MNIRQASALIDAEFEKLVGQTHPKRRLKELILGGLADNGFIPPFFLFSAAGLGKTRLLSMVADLARGILERRKIWIPRGEDAGTRTTFIEDVIPQMIDRDCILAIDEFDETKKPIQYLLRSCIQPSTSRESVEVRLNGETTFVWEPNRHTLAIATNKIDKLDTAFLSRLNRIDLEFYSDDEMGQIIYNEIRDREIRFREDTLLTIARCNRGTARDVVHWINDCVRWCAIKGSSSLNRDDVAEIIKSRQTFPLGVTVYELRTLLHLEKHGELALKELAARNVLDFKEQNANEKYLLQRGLLMIEGKRHLTGEGRAFLRLLRDENYIE